MTTPLPAAVQLYTFRDTTRQGADAFPLDHRLLEELASLGYAGVETLGVPGGDTVAATRALAAAGLLATSVHARVRPEDPEAFDRACGEAAELGAPLVIVQGNAFASLAEVDAFAARLEAASRIAARHGLRLALHNHDGEMRDVPGSGPGYELLRDRTDPAIGFEIDVFWVAVAGRSPSEVIAALGDRVPLLHVKDGAELPRSSSEPFVNVAIGTGILDQAPAVAAATAAEWLIVEFDHVAGSPLAAVRDSLDHLVERGLARRGAP